MNQQLPTHKKSSNTTIILLVVLIPVMGLVCCGASAIAFLMLTPAPSPGQELSGIEQLIYSVVPIAEDKLSHDMTMFEMSQLHIAVELYLMEHKQLPVALEQVTQGSAPTLAQVPHDPWSSPYHYEIKGENTFEIRSLGPDRTLNTDDDILYIPTSSLLDHEP